MLEYKIARVLLSIVEPVEHRGIPGQAVCERAEKKKMVCKLQKEAKSRKKEAKKLVKRC